jgi:hypothetical protein
MDVQSYTPPRQKYDAIQNLEVKSENLASVFSDALFGPPAAEVPLPPDPVFTFSPWSSPQKTHLAFSDKPFFSPWDQFTKYLYSTQASIESMAVALSEGLKGSYPTQQPKSTGNVSKASYDFLWAPFVNP